MPHAQHDDEDHRRQKGLFQRSDHGLLRLAVLRLFGAQVFSQDFSNNRFRQLLAHSHLLGHLVGRQVFLAVSPNIGFLQSLVGQDDEGFHRLPGRLVGNTITAASKIPGCAVRQSSTSFG